MNYAKAIKELRQKMIISQEELAKILGVAYPTLNKWENSHTKPRFYRVKKQLNKLFDKYGIKAD